jgi:hypothetical protein
MKDRVFTILHLSLAEHAQPSLLAFKGNRESWLRHALSERFEFFGRESKKFEWVPRIITNEHILGLIQAEKPYEYHDAPAEGGGERVDNFWQGTYVFLDPTHHEDGQKLAIENDVVGTPRSLALALFNCINSRDDAPFSCIPKLIFSDQDFWNFAKESGEILKYITFRFAIPNMFSPQSDIETDLKATGMETGADEVEVSFKSEVGVRTDNDRVRSAVDYSKQGAGTVTAKNFQGRSFSSNKLSKTERVRGNDLANPSDVTVTEVAKWVLGRE